jgi:hypothetical protein
MYMVINRGGIMPKYYIRIEREVSLEIQAEDYEQAEENAMNKFIANPEEELLLNKVVEVTEEE